MRAPDSIKSVAGPARYTAGMATGDLVLYLTLSPEFGGTRFGPFEGLEARLGSDRERCHITLPESLGVSREHCKVIRQGSANMILSPSERTAAVFLWKGDARRPVQVQTPTAVRPGDSFSLVTAEGPRFIIELGELPADVRAARSPAARNRGRNRLSVASMGEALKQFGIARLFTMGPFALAARAWYFVKTGAIFQPRYIILGTIMIFGYLTTGVSSCAAFKFKRDTTSAQTDTKTCKEALAYAEDMGGNVENFAFDQLASTITGAPAVGLAMKKDTAFLDQVKAEAKKIAEDPGLYEWLYAEKSTAVTDFAEWRARVDKSEQIDPNTKRLAPYVGVSRNRVKGDWGSVLDSTEQVVCGRGPSRLTYRQAKNLGMSAVQLDAYVLGDATLIAQDEAERGKLLALTAIAAGEPPPEKAPASVAEIISQGASTCLRAEGDDDRDDPVKMLAMLSAQIGTKAKHVPEAEGNYAPIARIAKLFAADVKGATYGDSRVPLISFVKSSPSSAVAEVPGGPWVMQRTAEVVARALVLPCEAVLNKDKAKMEAVFGTLPQAVPCLVLNYRLTHGG